LLLDTYTIKALLLHLPSMEAEGGGGAAGAKASPAYVKLVNSKAAHVEMILKLIGTPEDMLLERFKIMWPHGQSADLQMVMTLKGTKRSEQQVLLDMLGLNAASKVCVFLYL
jgi:hypothetical protein